ncbi:Zn-dependent exopeptidase [Gyrodon lividus]|nr:Zn-dependent exopeptidase [Gyrodon lividus]
MKPTFLILPLIGGSFAATIQAFYDSGNVQQVVLNGQIFDASPSARVGFSLDLNEKRLVQMEGKEPVWMTELEKIAAKANGVKFFDITDTPDLDAVSHVGVRSTPSYPPPCSHEQVTKVIKALSTAGPRANLEKFSSFRTRYYRSETGRESQRWLLSKIRQITKESASPELQSLITITEVHHSWGQHSIVARINGSSTVDHRIVVIGAHQDSANSWPFLPSPGADDDGSGTVTILESYRVLVASGFKPQRPVEFHWYSAEENGLLGSQAVAQSYATQGLEVYAMSQYDMTAWVKRGTREEIGVIVDFVDDTLTKYNKQLIDAYLSIPYVDTKCGYACSDHASWSKAGYPAIFTIEASFENSNHANIHTSNDRIDISSEFSFEHMLEFSKLAVAFAIELGEL